MKLSSLVMPGLLILACSNKPNKPSAAGQETNGGVQAASKESSDLKLNDNAPAAGASSPASDLKITVTEPKLNEAPDMEDSPPSDTSGADPIAVEPAVTTGAPKTSPSISREDALNHITPGLVDFACKKSSSTQVVCHPVDVKRRNVAIPSEAKVEWFGSDGTEESLKSIRADLQRDAVAGTIWSIALDDFLSKAVLVRVTRDQSQADIYVTPED
jgi:hypothetical protein